MDSNTVAASRNQICGAEAPRRLKPNVTYEKIKHNESFMFYI
jgi:hypothetical protein